jgi:hypothetical protein
MCSHSAPSSMTRLHSWLRLPRSEARTEGAMMLREQREESGEMAELYQPLLALGRRLRLRMLTFEDHTLFV